MKSLIVSLALVVLTGCATKPVLTGTQVVKVPLTTKCTPTMNITEIKEYPLSKAMKNMSAFEKVQLLIAERSLLMGQNIELKAALAECTK